MVQLDLTSEHLLSTGRAIGENGRTQHHRVTDSATSLHWDTR